MIYLAPLKTWVVEILKGRENNSKVSNTKMPFIVMTSGAKVIKGKPQRTRLETLQNVEKIIQNQIQAEYKGCIISNQINANLNYSQGATIVGYDFTGKAIIANEYGRKISQPIIESLEIKTSGTNNLLKTATINVRCFSLKQFEMFELFFCKAGMHILVEYGDNSFASVLNDVMINKTDYGKFVETFKSFTTPTIKQFGEYLEKCKKSNGSYDRVAGILTNYSFSIEQDGTYSVSIDVSQSNEYNLALPKTFMVKYQSFAIANREKTGFNQWKNQILSDLPGLKKPLIDSLTEEQWGKHFFNWAKTNETKLDESASNEPYLSLQFILEILMNNPVAEGGVSPEFIFKIPEFKVGDKPKKIIPISMHPNMISNDEAIIFPHENLPEFTIPNEKTGEIKISQNKIDGRINGISMVEPNKDQIYLEIPDQTDPKLTQLLKVEAKENFVIGNALNIFVRYREIGEAWEKNYTTQDFLLDILDRINDNSYELFRLRIGSLRELSESVVMDVLLSSPGDKLKNKSNDVREEYRFKPGNINSNVRDFKFNFEMSDRLAAATIFNSAKFLASQKFKNTLNQSAENVDDGISLPKGAYQSIDYSSFSTADGYYSINEIQYHQTIPFLQELTKKDLKETNSEITNEIKKSYNSKTKKFKIKKGDVKTLIFTDKAFIVDTFKLNDKRVRSQYELVTPITINVTIDGISGITCGETFKIDGVPEQYNKLGSFQITNTKHVVNNEQGWTTEIEADFRYGV